MSLANPRSPRPPKLGNERAPLPPALFERRVLLAALAMLALAANPARAQWSRVVALPPTDFYSVETKGDTILAGSDQAVWISTDRGGAWARSSDLPGGPTSAEALRLAGGRLWAGTYGQGVFRSSDLGLSWQPHSQGLAGGAANSHLYVLDFATRGDSLLAATDGAGVFALRLSSLGSWSPFGTAHVNGAAGSVKAIEEHGGRLVTPAGANGVVFHNDRGQPDWTLSYLNNTGISPGLQGYAAAWTGSSWLVSTQAGGYRSAAGESPWTAVGPAGSGRIEGLVASGGNRTFAAFNTLASTLYHASLDEGTTWQSLGSFATVTYDLAILGDRLVAARGDGLWMFASAALSAPEPSDPPAPRLQLVGPHPVRGQARLRFSLPAGGEVRLEVFDVSGRLAGVPVARTLPAGSHEVAWHADGQPAGVYLARLSTGTGEASVKVVVAR